MKNIKLLFLVGFLTLILVNLSCKKIEKTDPGTVEIRLVNTVESSNGQHLYQDNVKLTEQPVQYGLYSSYAKAIGLYSVLWTRDSATESGTSITDVVTQNGAKYTFFYYKTKDDVGMLGGFLNQPQTVNTGKFKVRFLNISTVFDGKNLDVVDRNLDGISKGLGFGQQPVYIELPLTTQIRVSVVDQDKYSEIPTSSFESGKIYFVWFDTQDGINVDYHIVPEN